MLTDCAVNVVSELPGFRERFTALAARVVSADGLSVKGDLVLEPGVSNGIEWRSVTRTVVIVFCLSWNRTVSNLL